MLSDDNVTRVLGALFLQLETTPGPALIGDFKRLQFALAPWEQQRAEEPFLEHRLLPPNVVCAGHSPATNPGPTPKTGLSAQPRHAAPSIRSF